jgi:hypothetical protein
MIKDRPGFRLYPRGFIGGVPALRMEKMQPASILFQHDGEGRIAVTQPGDSELCVDQDVERLYASYIKQAGEVTSIAFRDQILAAAFNAFGTKSFFRWIQEQRTSPGMGDLQYRFLTETLNFLGGKKRQTDIGVWIVLIEAGDTCPPPAKYIEAVEAFFGVRPHEASPTRNSNLVDVIQAWCSRPSGIEDLLQTLHLLFGNP